MRHTMKSLFQVMASALLTATAVPASANNDAGSPTKEELQSIHGTKPPYSPYVNRNFPSRPLFGDTHLHTSFSFDAGAFGARLTPSDAYRFARGEQVTSSTGQPAKLSRPLDFLAVTDHSDAIGFFPMILKGDPAVMAEPQGRKWNEMINGGHGAEAALDIIRNFSSGTIARSMLPYPGTKAYGDAWSETIKAAEAFNDPSRFTTFIAYEWTSNTGGNNLHRNIIYRDGGSLARQMEPYTTMKPIGSDNPRDLWRWMGEYEKKTGGRVLAIAHNGNLSNGRMFPIIESFTGKKIDKTYARLRAQWEPLYEATQTKGDSETHPYLSPNDEFANFERWDKGNLDGSEVKKKNMLEFEYVRSALKNGLKLEKELGTNPYKFGLVAGSDAHTGLTAMEEENFFSKTTPQEPSPERMTKAFFHDAKTGVTVMDWEVSASGYAAVWARENTREAIFDAMERRETYATTGTRMVVRFFGGFDFVPQDAQNRIPAQAGYTKGVPMGGDLKTAPKGKAITFLVAALKDPIGANLDRYQIVKGWVDKSGNVHEKVYDVAWQGIARREQVASCLPWARPWTFKTPPGPTPSARLS